MEKRPLRGEKEQRKKRRSGGEERRPLIHAYRAEVMQEVSGTLLGLLRCRKGKALRHNLCTWVVHDIQNSHD